jgi:hypothetical protein
MIRPAVRRATISLGLAIIAPLALQAQVSGREDLEFKWSKQLGAGATLVIRNPSGPITVRQATGNRVEISAVKRLRGRARASDIGFDVRETSDQVEICALFGDQESCRDRGPRSSDNVRGSVEFTVLLPPNARLRAATGNGAIAIERAGAEVSAATGNGEIKIGETTGRVDASTGNGDVQVAGANGPVNVSTGNGRVYVRTARGSVDASTGNGDIDVSIKSLPIDTDMKFSSGSGGIHIGLPSEFNGRIDATTGNGTLRSEFDIAIVGRLDAHHVRGTIGSGGPLLRLVTGNGVIELQKN